MTLQEKLDLANVLLSSITIIIVSVTLYLQKKELRATISEMVTQNETSKIQRFENTFFKLIDSLNNLRLKLESTNELYVQSPHKGDHFFQTVLNYVNSKFYEYEPAKQLYLYDAENHEYFKQKYNQKPKPHFEIPVYYSHVHNILIFMKDANLPEREIWFYYTILKSNLANPEELVLIYYYLGFNPFIGQTLKDFIKKNNLLLDVDYKHFPSEEQTFINIFYPDVVPFKKKG